MNAGFFAVKRRFLAVAGYSDTVLLGLAAVKCRFAEDSVVVE